MSAFAFGDVGRHVGATDPHLRAPNTPTATATAEL